MSDFSTGSEPDQSVDLRSVYQRRFSRTAEYRNRVWQTLYSNFFFRYISPQDTVLDLGAGWCEFSNNIEARVTYAMDLNPDTKKFLRESATFLHQDCSQTWPLADESLDVVFTSNFFEHLPDKASLQRTVEQAFRCLAKGGRLICLGPNVKYLPGAYWDFWDHYIPLTEASLSELLEIAGFEIEECIPRFLPYTMSTGRTPPVALLRTYLRLPLVWRWFGKQFLVVGRKTAC